MKHYETRTHPAEEYKHLTSRTCDICKDTIERVGYCDVDEVKLCHRVGNNWPSEDGPEGNELDIDICLSCFHNKLLPWLKEQGVERDYERF